MLLSLLMVTLALGAQFAAANRSNWQLDFTIPTNHPIVDFADCNDSLYAAADNTLYANDGNTWRPLDAPTYITSLQSVNLSNTESPNTQWSQTYGGTSHDVAHSVVQASDAGYALAGYAYPSGSIDFDDFLLVKIDSSGSVQWSKTYGGTRDDEAYSVVQTSDEGYALAGCTWSYGAGGGDFWLVKTDANGNVQWRKTYGGIGWDEAHSVVQTSDGGYAIAGITLSFGAGSYDFWLVKTDASGNQQWNRTYGGTSWDWASAMVQTTDGGFAIAGYTNSYGVGSYDFWLVKTDVYGNEEWNKTYGGTSNEFALSVVQTGDGGYALAGNTLSYGGGGFDFWLVKTDASGNQQWNRAYGGAGNDYGTSVVQTVDQGYALVGSTYSFGAGSNDFWLVKIDSIGNVQWNQTYGGTSGDGASALVQTNDGGFAMAGYTSSYGAGGEDIWLVKTLDASVEELVVGCEGGLYCYDGESFCLVFSVFSYIRVLGIYNSTLYAGTFLDDSPRLYYCSGPVGNSSNWYIDSGFAAVLNFSGAFGSIDSMAVYDGKMYVASGKTVYCFDGSGWSVALSYEYAYAFLDMQVCNGKLYLATRDLNRMPLYLGGTGFSGTLIEYDGENWTTILGHDYWIYSLEVYDDKLYVGTANRICTFNGTDWDVSFYSGEGAFYAISMITYDGKIYAGMGNGYIFADPAPTTTSPDTIVVPEFPSTTILAVFMILTMLTVALTRKNRSRRLIKNPYSHFFQKR